MLTLTGWQIRVLLLLEGGLSNDQIAARLHVTIETVKSGLKVIYKKLDVQSRVEAVIAFERLGRITPTIRTYYDGRFTVSVPVQPGSAYSSRPLYRIDRGVRAWAPRTAA